MYSKIFKFYFVLKKIKWIKNKSLKTKIIIFDYITLQTLKKYVLKNYQYFVISNRLDKIKLYLSIEIIMHFFKNYIFFLNKKLLIQDIYFLTLIEIINPKIVLTMIDNSFQFCKIAKNINNKNIKFIALQASMKHQRKFSTHLYRQGLLKKNLNLEFYYPLYLLLGKYDLKECSENNIKIIKSDFVGSLNLANFLKSIKKKTFKKKYDICLISDHGAYHDEFGKEKIRLDNFKLIEKGYIALTKWTIKLSIKNKLKFIFIFKRKKNTHESKNEKFYYKKLLSKKDYSYLLKNSSFNSRHNVYNSYKKVFQSKLTLSVSSTLLREALVTKNKILSCNFTGFKIFDFPIKGLCYFSKINYKKFEERVKNLIKIKKKDYFSKLSKNPNYLIHHSDPEMTIGLIQKHINYYF